MPAITDVKTASGNPLTLVNISSSGALVEGNARIKPGERVTLVMEGLEPKQVPGRVVRSIVTAIAGTGTLRFQTGIAFDQRIRLPLPASPAAEVSTVIEACRTSALESAKSLPLQNRW